MENEKEFRKLLYFFDRIGLDYRDVYFWDDLSNKVTQLINEQSMNDSVSAMNYLSEKDTTLVESLKIAKESGYMIEDLNSILLANLHLKRKLHNEWTIFKDNLENDIRDYILEDDVWW